MPRCSLPQFDVLAALWRALHYLSVEKIREACAGASSGHVFKMAFRSSTAGDCTKHCSGDGINNIRIVAKSRPSRAPRTCRGVNSSMAYLSVVVLCISALLERCDAMPNAGTSTDRHLRAAISDEQIKFFIAAARVEWRSSKKHHQRKGPQCSAVDSYAQAFRAFGPLDERQISKRYRFTLLEARKHLREIKE